MTTQRTLMLLQRLSDRGTPLDPTVMEELRTNCRGLKIIQINNIPDNVVHIQAGQIHVMMSVVVLNTSDRPIHIRAMRLLLPWSDVDFQWQEKLSLSELGESGGYVTPASGPFSFAPKAIINHNLQAIHRLDPDDQIEGLLLGTGTGRIAPQDVSDKSVMAELVVLTTAGESYSEWIELLVSREKCKPRNLARRRLFDAPDPKPVGHGYSTPPETIQAKS